MSTELFCPTCGESCLDEDYCPRHGVKLLPRVGAKETSAATTSVSAAVETQAVGADSDNKLSRFMQRLGLRRVAGETNLGKDTSTVSPPAADSSSPLPEALREKGWRLSGPLLSTAAVDVWPVQRIFDGQPDLTGHFHRYRTGALTTRTTYLQLESNGAPQLVDVLAHGTVDFGGARADYELVAGLPTSTGLDEWLASSAPSESRALHLLPALSQLLRQLATGGVRPLTLEPALLAHAPDGVLWMKSAAALAEVSSVEEYHAEYARSALLPRGWTAPELMQRNMLTDNAAVFSLGQLLAQCMWGQPCSLSELETGAVPFQTLSDARLARVMMGCLWPRSAGRWTADDLQQAVAGTNVDSMPTTPPWASLVPGASSEAFSFAGASYWRLEDLLAAVAQPVNWAEAIGSVEAILTWAEGTAWAGQAELMRQALERGRSADWVLVAIRRAVCPDAPLTWRGLDLSDAQAARSLARLAQRALREGAKADAAALHELFEADLRGAFTPGSNT